MVSHLKAASYHRLFIHCLCLPGSSGTIVFFFPKGERNPENCFGCMLVGIQLSVKFKISRNALMFHHPFKSALTFHHL